MNLRATVDSIMNRWGHDILLQRRVRDTGTGVYRLRENAGFTNQLEKHTVRQRLPGSESLTNAIEERIEGKVADVDLVFYFRWNVVPDKGDRIYDKDPRGYFTYIIDWAFPLRFQGGRIEYWVAGVTLENSPVEN